MGMLNALRFWRRKSFEVANASSGTTLLEQDVNDGRVLSFSDPASGAITLARVVTLAAVVGADWLLENNASQAVIVRHSAAGKAVTVRPGARVSVQSDGTNLRNANESNLEINVYDYGAAGDGVTDDTAKIEAAFAAAKAGALVAQSGAATLRLPPGKFMVTRSSPTTIGLDLSATTPVTIVGDGDLSEIVFDEAAALDTGISFSGASGYVAVRKLKFSGSVGCAILLGATTAGAEVIDCDFSGFARHIPLSGYPAAIVGYGDDVTIEGNWFHDAGQTGLKTERTYTIVSGPGFQGHRWKVQNNTLSPSFVTVGVAAFDTSDLDVSTNTIEMGGARSIYDPVGGDGYGICIYSHGFGGTPKRVLISKNQISNSAGSGLYMVGIGDAVVSENTFHNCCLTQYHKGSILAGACAIAAPALGRVVVSKNIFSAGSRYGISFQGAGVELDGNKMTDGADASIWCAGAADGALVTKNDVRQPAGTSAIVKSATTSVDFSNLAPGDTLGIKITGGTKRTVTFSSGDIAGGGPGVAKKIFDTLLGFAAMSTPASSGTSPPTLTLTGTPVRPDIDLRVETLTAGARDAWTGRYSTDGGGLWRAFTSAASGIAVLDNAGTSIGVTMGFANTSATADNVWSAYVNGGATVNCTVDLSLSGAGATPNSIFIAATARGANSIVEVVDGTARGSGKLELPTGAVTGGFTHLIASSSNTLVKCTFAKNRMACTGLGASGPNGIYIQSATESTIDDNKATGCQNGIAILAGADNVLSKNKTYANYAHGLYVASGAVSTLVKDNHSRGNIASGCFDDGTNTRIIDNDLSANYAGGGMPATGGGIAGTPTNREARGNIHVSQSAAQRGTATLVAGTKDVTSAEILAGTSIRLTRKTQGAGAGHLSYALTVTTFNGDSSVNVAGKFTITSSNGADTGDIDWEIVH
jgi:parallel beta-helix repeat protein